MPSYELFIHNGFVLVQSAIVSLRAFSLDDLLYLKRKDTMGQEVRQWYAITLKLVQDWGHVATSHDKNKRKTWRCTLVDLSAHVLE